VTVRIATTNNGWTSEDTCRQWFVRNFIPQAQAHSDPSKPIVLLFDGHGSHLTLEMIEIAMENNIHLFCLPPHTTHRLQPCDVGAFGPLKRAWQKRCDDIITETGFSLRAKDVVREYMTARSEALKPEIITKAWEHSGISTDAETGYAVTNPSIFTEDDFAPSIPTSILLHLPEGYPMASIPPHTIEWGSQAQHVIADDEADVSSEDETDGEFGQNSVQSELYGGEPEDVNHDAVVDEEENAGPEQRVEDNVDVNDEPRSGSQDLIDESTRAVASTIEERTAGPSHLTFPQDFLSTVAAQYDDPRSDPVEPDWENITEASFWQSEIVRLRSERNKARNERDNAAAHATLAGLKIRELNGQVNAKSSKRSERVFASGGRAVTSAEGLAAARDQAAARAAKKEKALNKKNEKEMRHAEVLLRRRDVGREGMEFKEARLRQLKHPQLRDLAWCLQLAEDGTRAALIERIECFFLQPENTCLKSQDRFAYLFGGNKSLLSQSISI
jgi:hypothetical protein